MLNEIQTIQKQIKKLEKGTGQVLPTDFIQQIQQQVQQLSGCTSRSIEVVIAPFQADPVVARRVICGDAH